MYDVSMNFIECIRLREYWNYILCGEWEPFGVNFENRWNMNQYEVALAYKKRWG